MATLVELQQEYVFLCGKEKGISVAESEILSRLEPIYKAEKRARKAEKKARKHGYLPGLSDIVARAIIGDDFSEESPGDSERVQRCLQEVSFRFMGKSQQIRDRLNNLRQEIVRLGGVVPSCSF